MRLRDYDPADAGPTRDVFLRAIRLTAARDYDARQVRAWSEAVPPPEVWAQARAGRRTIVAEADGRVAGFTDVDDSGYIDMLFVDPDFAGRGVGGALLAEVVDRARAAGIDRLAVNASRTARGTFERAGFRVEAEEVAMRGDVALPRYRMSRIVDVG